MKQSLLFKSIIIGIGLCLICPQDLAARSNQNFENFYEKLSHQIATTKKDAHIMWQWAVKKTNSEKISPELARKAEKAFQRTGKPAIITGIVVAIAVGVLSAGAVAYKKGLFSLKPTNPEKIREKQQKEQAKNKLATLNEYKKDNDPLEKAIKANENDDIISTLLDEYGQRSHFEYNRRTDKIEEKTYRIEKPIMSHVEIALKTGARDEIVSKLIDRAIDYELENGRLLYLVTK